MNDDLAARQGLAGPRCEFLTTRAAPRRAADRLAVLLWSALAACRRLSIYGSICDCPETADGTARTQGIINFSAWPSCFLYRLRGRRVARPGATRAGGAESAKRLRSASRVFRRPAGIGVVVNRVFQDVNGFSAR